MKNYLKSQLKNLPMIIIVSIVFCGINTLATSYLFKAKEVEFDNSNTNIESTNVGDAIDELYTAANNFATYDTRLQGVETKIGNVPSGKTTQGQIDDLNNSSLKCVYANSGYSETIYFQCEAGKKYLLITAATGYGIPQANANVYLFGWSGSYATSVKLTSNSDAMPIAYNSSSGNFSFTFNNSYARMWIYELK